MQSCFGGTSRPNNDEKTESIVDRYVERACRTKTDKCSKPYESNSGEHGWKGKGEGSIKAKHENCK